jgi:hypothetical protein
MIFFAEFKLYLMPLVVFDGAFDGKLCLEFKFTKLALTLQNGVAKSGK